MNNPNYTHVPNFRLDLDEVNQIIDENPYWRYSQYHIGKSRFKFLPGTEQLQEDGLIDFPVGSKFVLPTRLKRTHADFVKRIKSYFPFKVQVGFIALEPQGTSGIHWHAHGETYIHVPIVAPEEPTDDCAFRFHDPSNLQYPMPTDRDEMAIYLHREEELPVMDQVNFRKGETVVVNLTAWHSTINNTPNERVNLTIWSNDIKFEDFCKLNEEGKIGNV